MIKQILEDSESNVVYERRWFEREKEKTIGAIETLHNQGIITYETEKWLSKQIAFLDKHSKGIESEYYKLKNFIENGGCL